MDDQQQVETPKPTARIVGGPPRTASYRLVWPVEFDGKVYETIGIRRVTANEVDAFVQAVKAGDDSARLPVFDAPPEVLDALDADDSARLNEMARPMLPATFQAESEPVSETSAASQDSRQET